MPTSRSLRRTHAHFSPLGFSAEKARWAAEAAAGRETRGHDAVGAEISRTRPTRGGGGGGPTDPLDPGEARFWRALPGEGDGTYVARAAALAHPVLRCFVRLHSLEHPAEEGLAPMRARRVRGCDGVGAEGVEVVMPPHERDKASVVASKHLCELLLAL